MTDDEDARRGSAGAGRAGSRGPVAIPPGGVLYDVPLLHEPTLAEAATDTQSPRRPFEKGVGLEGYDRRTGVAVPTHPALRVPGEARPRALPFGDASTDAAPEHVGDGADVEDDGA